MDGDRRDHGGQQDRGQMWGLEMEGTSAGDKGRGFVTPFGDVRTGRTTGGGTQPRRQETKAKGDRGDTEGTPKGRGTWSHPPPGGHMVPSSAMTESRGRPWARARARSG